MQVKSPISFTAFTTFSRSKTTCTGDIFFASISAGGAIGIKLSSSVFESADEKSLAADAFNCFGSVNRFLGRTENSVEAFRISASLSDKNKNACEEISNALFAACHSENFSAVDFRNLYDEYKKYLSGDIEETVYNVPTGSVTACRYTDCDIINSKEVVTDIEEGDVFGTETDSLLTDEQPYICVKDFEPSGVTSILSDSTGWKTENAGSMRIVTKCREFGIIYLQKSIDPQGTYADYKVYVDGNENCTLIGVKESGKI